MRKSFVCGVFIQDRCVLAMKIINANVKERTLSLCLFRFCSKCVNHGKNYHETISSHAIFFSRKRTDNYLEDCVSYQVQLPVYEVRDNGK